MSAAFVSACSAVAPAMDVAPFDSTLDGRDVPPDHAQDSIDASDTPADGTPTANECQGHATMELTSVALSIDGGWRLQADNLGTPAGFDDAVQPTRNDCAFRAVHQRLYHYRMRSRAALRVSTDNPGTDPTFDTALFVARLPCTPSSATVLACNDDDPFVSQTPPNNRSLLTTPVLDAGTEVVISVSGFGPAFGSGRMRTPDTETGTFELIVREMPPLADDEPCDLRRLDNVCARSSTCVPDAIASDRGICRRDGSAAGATCADRVRCDAPLACDTDNNTCYATVLAGASCDRLGVPRARCAARQSCVSVVRGAATGRCVQDGTALFSACDAGLRCDPPLVCRPTGTMTGVCLRPAVAGGDCSVSASQCASGQSCLGLTPGADIGRCTADGSQPGTPCRSGDDECDAPLFCINSGFIDRRCRTSGTALGGACGTWGACSFDADCANFEPSQPYTGICTNRGEEGGICASTGLACRSGSICTNPTNRDFGRCLRIAYTSMPCDVVGRHTRCEANTTCVRESVTTGSDGVCRLDGTRAGAICRAASPRCDPGLACTVATGAGRCVRDAMPGGACDARFATVRCPGGQFCVGADIDSGVCRAVVVETEPNDAPSPTSTSVAVPGGARGVINRFDVDCYAVDVPSGARVYAQATATDGRCSANLALDLYRVGAEPVILGTDTDSGAFGCPRIDGADATWFAWARGLDAGRYALCVREASSRFAAGAYLLAIDVR